MKKASTFKICTKSLFTVNTFFEFKNTKKHLIYTILKKIGIYNKVFVKVLDRKYKNNNYIYEVCFHKIKYYFIFVLLYTKEFNYEDR